MVWLVADCGLLSYQTAKIYKRVVTLQISTNTAINYTTGYATFLFIMRDSWLNPNGEIIEVGDFQHNEYAYEILEKEFGDLGKLLDYMEENRCQSATEVLHLRGWVRIKYNTAYLPRIEILGNCIDLTKPRKNTIDPAMNERQMRVAKELCEKCNTELHVAINDKRFW